MDEQHNYFLTKDDGTPYNVLVVEDKSLDQMIATHALQAIGCTVELAKDGVQAMNRIKNNRYDLVFMDCSMPIMDGFEATRRIRDNERQQHNRSYLPIVALTAHVLKSDRRRCVAAGMNDYVSKPLRMEKAREVLIKWCKEYVPYSEQW